MSITSTANSFKRGVIVVGLLGWIGPASAAATTTAETTIEAPGPAGALQGTMLAPTSEHVPPKRGPVALIIPGSGPTDRNGNNPGGVKAAPYRLLADGLVTHGITTVRIDKRGMFGSAAATPDANAVTIGDYADDIHAWTHVILHQTGAPCLWLIGHSEGGLVAMVAAHNDPEVCGLVLIATAGRPMGEVLRSQLEANPANAALLGQAEPMIDALEAGKHVETTNLSPALRPLFRQQVQGFLISAFAYDPQRVLTDYAKPVLIIQGLRDLQVTESDADALEKADPNAKLVLLPGVNHVLKFVDSEDRQANVAAYADPHLPLAPGIVDAISDFLSH